MKVTKYNDVVKEYVRRLGDEDLRFLSLRLGQRLGGDVGEVLEILQRSADVDRWLSTAPSANDFFDMVDLMDSQVQGEVRKRLSHEKKREAS